MLFRRRRRQFEDLVLTELPSLFRLAFRLTGDRTKAEDLVQETLLRAYRAFDDVEIREHGLKPWLFRILHNIFFNDVTAQKRSRVLKEEPTWELIADQHPDAWPEVDIHHVNWDQFDDEIKHGVESLTPEHRIVLLLWALEQLSYKEIAEICDIPVGTVMSRLYRARRDMSEKLATYAESRRLRKFDPAVGGSPNKVETLSPKGSYNGLP